MTSQPEVFQGRNQPGGNSPTAEASLARNPSQVRLHSAASGAGPSQALAPLIRGLQTGRHPFC
jgi:hypothetical protein